MDSTMASDESAAPTALILGLSGAIGYATAAALAARGYAIAGLARDPDKAQATVEKRRAAHKAPGFAVRWHRGDALDVDAVRQAAVGARVILHGVNPPGYRRWREDGIPMLANAIEAARASGARLLFPGNVYVFSPEAGKLLNEQAPKQPRTVKGQVRLEMEQMLAQAAETGVRSIVLRAGDFFGPAAENTWFAQIPVRRGGRVRKIRSFETSGVGHSWAYLPDLGETFAILATREADLPAHVVYHFAGHWTLPGATMAQAVRHTFVVCGEAPLRIAPFPWLAVKLLTPFVPFLREAREMLWLWRHPLRLDNARLARAIGHEPHTPLIAALAATLGLCAPSSHVQGDADHDES